jgi:hypothetical protein
LVAQRRAQNIDGLLSIWFALSVASFAGAFDRFGVAAYAALSFLPLAAVIYELSPLWFGIVASACRGVLAAQAFCMSCLAFAFYGVGFLQGGAGRKHLMVIFGAISILFLVVLLLRALEPWILKRQGALSVLFRPDGELYWCSALVSLAMTTLMLAFKLDAVADQFALVTYFGLTMGMCLKVIALVRARAGSLTPQVTSL